MPTDVEFRLLGPLAVIRDGAAVPLPRGKQRALLAALLLRRGEVVSVADLVDVLWGADPPQSARISVQNYVMRVRIALGEAASLLATMPGGYVLTVRADQLDVTRFEVLIREASAAARAASWQEAATKTSQALGLWRGAPLADVDAEFLQAREGPQLAELRLQGLEIQIDADLHLGRHREAIGELQRLIAAEPLRERLHELLMLALYADGQQAEAMSAYQHARRVLKAELGTEPGAALQELHQQILTGQPVVAGKAQADTAPPVSQIGDRPVPRELPGDVAAFTGRSAELAALDKLLLAQLDSDHQTTAAVISAVSGTAGVGKTALAIHWAHRAAPHFPDGHLHVNLRGYDPRQPLTASDALARFLRALGVPGQEIPAEEAERAARYRSLLTGRQMLILLDNAATVDQVRPLLPGHSDCRVLVTSRDSLAGLVARDGAKRLDLDLLPLDDAVALLRDLVGEAAEADAAAVTKLAEQCARLPLTLRIAAEFAATRPTTPLADLVTDLADEQTRLDLLDTDGDPHTAVRAVFSWSCESLDEDSARTFRLAGLHPGADFELYAVAALTDMTLERARRALDVLTRAHLMQPAAPGRYGMHDLLRSYARELAAAHDGGTDSGAALTRLFEYYLAASARATDVLFGIQQAPESGRLSFNGYLPVLSDPATARAFLASERANLVAITVHSSEHAQPALATRIAAALTRYLHDGSYYPEGMLIFDSALHAARRTGDRSAEAQSRMGLGTLSFRQGRLHEAGAHIQEALAICRAAGDLTGQARAVANLGSVEFERGSYDRAAAYYHQALDLFEATGNNPARALALANLGAIHARQGRNDESADHYQQALALCEEAGDVIGAALYLDNLANARRRQNRLNEAADLHAQALARYRQVGNKPGEASALNGLGSLAMDKGDYQQAIDYQLQALELYREVGSRSGETEVLYDLGQVCVAMGEPAEAAARFSASLGLATQVGDKFQQARAHDGLARTHLTRATADQARQHWQLALTLFTEVGTPEAQEVRAQLAALDGKKGQ